MRHTLSGATVFVCLAAATMHSLAQDNAPRPNDSPQVDALASDLQLLQGKWELFHGNDGKGAPTIHSIKEIKGNRETLRRFDLKSGQMTREHSVDFALASSGNVRVFTFYAVGGDPKLGLSFVYKLDADNFYDIPGLLQGSDYRNYQQTPKVWHWKKIKESP